MQEYVIELSKYFIAFFMVLYTASCFYTFRYPTGEHHKGIFILQDVLMFLVQVLCFLNLSLTGGDFQYLFFFAFILIFLFATITMVSLIYENINRLLLNNMCMLLEIGLCMVSRLSFDKAIRQYVIVLVSLIFSLLIPYLLGKIHFFKKITWLYATLGIALLSTVLILGEVTHGSKISFSLGGITFQPSEFVKILFLFFLAGALWENVSFQRVVLTAIIAGAHVVILVVSKDLGSALIFFVGFVFVVFAATRNYLYLFAGIVGGGAASYLAYQLFDHVRIRVLAWQDPWKYIDNKGYQITQSLYATLGIALLSTVLILGEVTHGSKISFSLGGITFQPSEFVKILFLFFLAGALWENVSFQRVVLTAIIAGAHVVILVVSKDLGSALIFFVGFVFVVFAATRNYLYLFAGIVGGGAASYLAYQLFDHVRIRVLAWQDPWKYIDNKGYQITQSLFAIGSGSWFGMGLLKGNPTAIPYVEADFIFSSICEELGVIFGMCLILICVSSFFEMIRIAVRIHDRFYQLVVYGIGIMYIFQIFLTIGGGTKFIPLTGVTLPFISYGGSSVMTTMIMFFIIQGIYIRLQKEGERRGGK